jgi:lipoic acid synthetase
MMGLPVWFKQEIPDKLVLSKIALLSEFNVHTVCQQARCPNLANCFTHSGVTFMLLGDTCTRNCKFCALHKSAHESLGLDLSEPLRVSGVVKKMELSYVVITSVTRDDLKDGGAEQFARTIELIHAVDARIKVEVLIPDFQGNPAALKRLLDSGPCVVGHNMETVKRLYRVVRPEADYACSLAVLARIKKMQPSVVTKSSLMLGMGETATEVIELMKTLQDSSCDIITLGQYLAPGSGYYPVKRFVTPAEFARYKEIALAIGFKAALSGPLVRSSYQAQEVYEELINSVHNLVSSSKVTVTMPACLQQAGIVLKDYVIRIKAFLAVTFYTFLNDTSKT